MIKIGFIGCGSISFRHLNNLKKIDDVKVVSVFDPNENNLTKFKESCGNKINVYRSDEDMIEKEVLDGVVITSPHTFHFKQIKMCLENGIDVLVEKPAVVNFQEAVEIREMMGKTGKKVVVGYQRHYMPVFNEARHIIRENFGNIIYISGFLSQYWFDQFKTGDSRKWRLDPKFSGKGQLTDSGSHFVASLFFLTALNPEKVSAFIDFREVQVDINTSFIVKFKRRSNRKLWSPGL
ncbi:MAG: Gfo/Idh/MocA family oxidoreductase [Candidatus Omnitrophica bacterium]|nr:Gfo/Idh/MocA family oxidoreductase [Candidatus Omnitrophota bacterium]